VGDRRSLGIPEETGRMKWTAPGYRGLGSEKERNLFDTYVFRGLRLAPARKTPLVDHMYQGRLRVTLCVRWYVVPRLRFVALYERGSVHVNTMGFHSRGILDVVAPVREVERDPTSPMTRGKSTNKVGCARQTPASLLAVVCCLTAPRRSPLSFRAAARVL
jgi:hypothetical protein